MNAGARVIGIRVSVSTIPKLDAKLETRRYASGGILDALMKAGVSMDDAHIYAEGVRRGGSLVTARVDDARAASAEVILRSSNGVDIGARRAEYATEGRGLGADRRTVAVTSSVPPVSPRGMGRT